MDVGSPLLTLGRAHTGHKERIAILGLLGAAKTEFRNIMGYALLFLFAYIIITSLAFFSLVPIMLP